MECDRLQLTSFALFERNSKTDNFALQETNVSLYSSDGALLHSIWTTSQTFQLRLLSFWIRSPTRSRASNGHWLPSLVTHFILQNHLDKNLQFPQEIYLEKRCENHYRPMLVFAGCEQCMQLFISSSSGKKLLLEITIMIYFSLQVNLSNKLFPF